MSIFSKQTALYVHFNRSTPYLNCLFSVLVHLAFSDSESVTSDSRPNACMQVYQWICGYNYEKNLSQSYEEQKLIDEKLTSIKQNKTTKVVLRTLVVVACSFMVFIFAYFSI